jgi:hypothetical protein
MKPPAESRASRSIFTRGDVGVRAEQGAVRAAAPYVERDVVGRRTGEPSDGTTIRPRDELPRVWRHHGEKQCALLRRVDVDARVGALVFRLSSFIH